MEVMHKVGNWLSWGIKYVLTGTAPVKITKEVNIFCSAYLLDRLQKPACCIFSILYFFCIEKKNLF